MKTLTIALALCLCSCNLLGQEHQCTLATVMWQDAITFDGKPVEEARLVNRVSFGCVEVRKDDILIIHEFDEGKPSTYTLIPKGWETKIIYLEVAHDPKGGKSPSMARKDSRSHPHPLRVALPMSTRKR